MLDASDYLILRGSFTKIYLKFLYNSVKFIYINM